MPFEKGNKLAFKPGQSGNPAGRPRGSRARLADQFIDDMYTDWVENGVAAIKQVRADRPHEYLKVVAAILPKQLEVQISEFERMSDSELRETLSAEAAVLSLTFEEGETEH